MHLNFIVDQTEKYSTWLSAGLAGTGGSRVESSVAVSPRSSIAMEGNAHFLVLLLETSGATFS